MATNNSTNSSFPLSATQGGLGVASPTAHGVLIAEGSSPATSLVLGAGQLLIGTTASDPVAATLTAGTGISINSASGAVTISATGALSWTNVTGTTQTIAANNGYAADNAALVTFTLPATAAIGEEYEIYAKNTGGWLIAQNTGQSIRIGNQLTTSGVGGSLASTSTGDFVRIKCITANVAFAVTDSMGNITYV